MEVSGQLQAPAALTPWKEPQVPIVYEAGWAPESVWKLWRRESFLVPFGNWSPTDHSVAIPIDLSMTLSSFDTSILWLNQGKIAVTFDRISDSQSVRLGYYLTIGHDPI
jgi:hypothetical protein